jgi:hypothetical protein
LRTRSNRWDRHHLLIRFSSPSFPCLARIPIPGSRVASRSTVSITHHRVQQRALPARLRAHHRDDAVSAIGRPGQAGSLRRARRGALVEVGVCVDNLEGVCRGHRAGGCEDACVCMYGKRDRETFFALENSKARGKKTREKNEEKKWPNRALSSTPIFSLPFFLSPFDDFFGSNAFVLFPSLSLNSQLFTMLVLFETSAGFALFKLLKDGRLDKPEVWEKFWNKEERSIERKKEKKKERCQRRRHREKEPLSLRAAGGSSDAFGSLSRRLAVLER